MLGIKTSGIACFHYLSPRSFPPTTLTFRHLKPTYSSSHRSIKMCSSAKQIIEHVVLFKAKPNADPSKLTAMVNNLNSLTSLNQVIHLSSGPLLKSSSSFSFTHILHSRYNSKSDLADYSAHPAHVSVVKEHVLPVVDDIMAVDWVATDFSGPSVVPHGSAMRLTFLKLKENLGEDEKSRVLSAVGGIKEKFTGIEQLTVGENFSPGRAKGYSIASIAVFRGVKELEDLETQNELVNEEKDKVRDCLDGVVVVDYVVPPTQTASL
ncbi:stress-response A/B barrel domain-containing protein UP3-like [Lycium barbarum]|uniref:stress-response A/B barrel domain-containing protein UP3-like n=1 Tax=Lycium barbarum TaxID=112863 RepID=UPI00293EC37E|nr:stress-response A/B barrel domain-containing protein UP3-like [Lycium barbarum]